jgi:hypothetical protein
VWRRGVAATIDGALGWALSEVLRRAAHVPQPQPASRRRVRLPGRRRSGREELRRALGGGSAAERRVMRRFLAVNAAASVVAVVPPLVRTGRTLGQTAAGIRLVAEGGADASLGRGLVRQFGLPALAVGALAARSPEGLAASVGLTLADGVAALLDSERRTLRDRALGTRMVEGPRSG